MERRGKTGGSNDNSLMALTKLSLLPTFPFPLHAPNESTNTATIDSLQRRGSIRYSPPPPQSALPFVLPPQCSIRLVLPRREGLGCLHSASSVLFPRPPFLPWPTITRPPPSCIVPLPMPNSIDFFGHSSLGQPSLKKWDDEVPPQWASVVWDDSLEV